MVAFGHGRKEIDMLYEIHVPRQDEALIQVLANAVIDAGLELMLDDEPIFFTYALLDEVKATLPAWAVIIPLT
jgi:hypothetical protein